MITLAETLSSPIMRLHSEVTADFHARAEDAETELDEEDEERSGDAEAEEEEASRR